MESLQLQEGVIAGEMLGDVDEQVKLPGDVDKQFKVSDVVDGQVHHFVQDGDEGHYSDDVDEQRQKWDAMDENKQMWDVVDEQRQGRSQLPATRGGCPGSSRSSPLGISLKTIISTVISRMFTGQVLAAITVPASAQAP